MGEDSERHAVSFSNFNPVALLSLIVLGVGVILASVSMGIGQWSRLDTDRMSDIGLDGATFKAQSLLSRCISFDLTQDIVEQGLTLDEQPQSGCLPVYAVNCSAASLPLVSALDEFRHRELHNSHDRGDCDDMKLSLQISAAFIVLGIIATFVAMILYFPLFHFGFYIAGAVFALCSIIFYAIGIGLFLDQDQNFAGFYSLDGSPISGCLSYGFGIALSAFVVNVIGTIAGLVAICYKKISPPKYEYSPNSKKRY